MTFPSVGAGAVEREVTGPGDSHLHASESGSCIQKLNVSDRPCCPRDCLSQVETDRLDSVEETLADVILRHVFQFGGMLSPDWTFGTVGSPTGCCKL